MLSICAVIAVRNDAQYLRFLLPLLANQGIDVAILDHESADDCQALFSEFAKNPIILLERIPFRGYFSLAEQLEAKQKIYRRVKHDWVIHHDVDEILENIQPGLTLRDAIQDAHDMGYDVINFDEFVFLPEPGSDYSDSNHYRRMLRYYFYEPEKNRLNRAWKRALNLDNTTSGGHRLSGRSFSISPVNHILRHYIALSYEHVKRKYLSRAFDSQELMQGWHKSRVAITESNLKLISASPFLFQLDAYDSKKFCKDRPADKHYWQWE